MKTSHFQFIFYLTQNELNQELFYKQYEPLLGLEDMLWFSKGNMIIERGYKHNEANSKLKSPVARV